MPGCPVAGKSPFLVIVFGAHGFDQTGCGLGVVPEQSICSDVAGDVVVLARQPRFDDAVFLDGESMIKEHFT